jgi:hypothetical protein
MLGYKISKVSVNEDPRITFSKIVIEVCAELGIPFDDKVLKLMTLEIWKREPRSKDDLNTLIHSIKTKENPSGEDYPEGYHEVLRLIAHKDHPEFLTVLQAVEKYNGKLMPDVYAKKSSQYPSEAKRKPIGVATPEGRANLDKTLDLIYAENEREMFKVFMEKRNFDSDAVITAEEVRLGVFVTQEMIDAGITHIVNDWDEAEDGYYTANALEVGDLLIYNNGMFYLVEKGIASLTYAKI